MSGHGTAQSPAVEFSPDKQEPSSEGSREGIPAIRCAPLPSTIDDEDDFGHHDEDVVIDEIVLW